MRQFLRSTAAPVSVTAALASPSSNPVVSAGRPFWEVQGMVAETKFMDRKDIEKMFPVQKPKVVAGEYGYQRGHYWSLQLVPNQAIRLPHDRRRLNPKPAEIVCVFGASGYLGAEIVRELLESPNIKTVRACTRYPTGIEAGSDLDKLLEQYPDKIELHECDVTDRIQVNIAANGADTLIYAVDYHCEYANNSHFEVFTQGAINVGWTGKSVRAERVIYCSGLDSTFASNSPYVDFRYRGEDACIANFPDATLIRFGQLYGKNYRYRGLGKFLYGCVYPRSLVAPLWVTDAARAVVRCVQTQRSVRMKLDLGGPEHLTHQDWAKRMSSLFKSRFVFNVPYAIARPLAKLAPLVMPNAWYDYNLLETFELDAVPRKAAMFDRLASWEQIAYKPKTMLEAAAIERGEVELESMAKLDEEFKRDVEDKDKEDLQQQEALAAAMGVHRARAEPGYGRGDGMELLAQEIYPGQQFRVRKAEGAKYPDTVKNPGPVSTH